MDDERLKRGTYLTEKYFDEQLERIREIRASERKFYINYHLLGRKTLKNIQKIYISAEQCLHALAISPFLNILYSKECDIYGKYNSCLCPY